MAIHVRPLTEYEERVLQNLVSSRQTPTNVVLRCRMILLSNQKWPVSRIAEYLGVHHHSVRTRIRRFNAQGLAGLMDRPRTGRPRTYGAWERETVLRLAMTDPRTLGLPLHTWTLSALQRQLADSGIAPSIGRETIRRILLSNDQTASYTTLTRGNAAYSSK